MLHLRYFIHLFFDEEIIELDFMWNVILLFQDYVFNYSLRKYLNNNFKTAVLRGKINYFRIKLILTYPEYCCLPG
jgi:hypothetical protein